MTLEAAPNEQYPPEEGQRSLLHDNNNNESDEVEARALRAVEEYQHVIQSELVVSALDQSAEAVAQALNSLILSHKDSMAKMTSMNVGLSQRLLESTKDMELLRSQLALIDPAGKKRGGAAATAVLVPQEEDARASVSAGGEEGVEVDSRIRCDDDDDGDGGNARSHNVDGIEADGTDTTSSIGQSVVASETSRNTLHTVYGTTTTTATTDGTLQSNRSIATVPGTSDASTSISTTHAATEEEEIANLIKNPAALAQVLANNATAESTIVLLKEDCDRCRGSIAELTQLLATVTQDSAQHRAELELLKATSVSRSAYVSMAEQRDTAVAECTQVKMQRSLLLEQLEAMQQAREREGEETERMAAELTEARAAVKQLRIEAAASGEGSADAAATHAHPGLWGLAMKELEAQATVAANQKDMQGQLAEAKESIQKLIKEKEQVQSALETLTAEDACLREDAQSMAYRNSILSQQVTSLLVKVESLKRALRNAGGGGDENLSREVSTATPAASPAASSTSASSWTGLTDREIRLAGEGEGVSGRFMLPSRRARLQQQQQVAGGPMPLHRMSKDAALAASEAQRLLQQRQSTTSGTTAYGAFSFADASSLSSPQSAHSRWPQDQTLPPQQRQQENTQGSYADGAHVSHGGDPVGAVEPLSTSHGRALDRSGLQKGQAAHTLLGCSPLDTIFFNASGATAGGASKERTGLEVERGLRSSLATFSARRRTVTLRNIGCGELEVSLPCRPRLPASDQLSGTALGRPSSYSVLDPLHGTVSRHGSTTEALMQVHAGSESEGAFRDGNSSSSESLVSESAHQDVVGFLAMLEADEDLGRFSVNSVAELVERNQELVKQLYTVTQRLESTHIPFARAHCKHTKSSRCVEEEERRSGWSDMPGEDVDSAVRGFHEKSVFASSEASPSAHRTTAAGAEAAPSNFMLRMGTKATIAMAGSHAGQNSRKRPRGGGHNGKDWGDHGSSTRNSSSSSNDDNGEEADGTEEGVIVALSNDNTASGKHSGSDCLVPATAVLPADLQGSVATLISAIVEKHKAHQLAADSSTADSLLRVMQAWQSSAQECHRSNAGGGGSNATRANEEFLCGVVRTLVRLCVEVTNRVYEAEGSLARVEEKVAERTLACGLDARKMVQGVAASLKEAVLRMAAERVEQHQRQRVSALASCDERSSSTGATSVQDVELLEHIADLLQTAALKDQTMQRVYLSAQERQAQFVTRKERKMARLAAKAKASARAARKAARATAITMAAATVGVTGSPNMSALPGVAVTITPRQHAQRAMMMMTMAAPAGGEGVSRRTSPVPPTHEGHHMLPQSVETLSGMRLDAQEGEGDEEGVHQGMHDGNREQPHCYVLGDDEEDEEDFYAEDEDDDLDKGFDEEKGTYTALKRQLAFAQAQHKQALEELSAEKARHIEMCERMWMLEVERDAAYTARAEALTEMDTMVKRTEYESIVGDLDSAKAIAEDLEAQLKYAHQEKNRLVNRVGALEAQAVEHNSAVDKATTVFQERIRQLEINLSETEGCVEHWRKAAEQEEDKVKRMQQLIQEGGTQLQETRHELEATLTQLQEARQLFLADDRSQQALLAMYPNDTALPANVELVHVLRDRCSGLEGDVTSLKEQVARLEKQTAAGERSIRLAVQQRQDAEVQLQEVLAREAATMEVRVIDPACEPRPESGETAAAGATDVSSGGDHRSATRSNPENVVAISSSSQAAGGAELATIATTSYRALQQRLQETESQLEGLRAEASVLRDAERAWKEREVQLRQQLDAMSRDPLSTTVKKYGLDACKSFEAAVAALNAKATNLRKELETSKEAQKHAEAELVKSQAALAEAEASAEEAQSTLARIVITVSEVKAQLSEAESTIKAHEVQHAADCNTIAARDASIKNLEEGLAALDAERGNLQTALHTCKTERAKFYEDNVALISKVTDLEQGLRQADEEKRAANAALAQGMSSATRRHQSRRAAGALGGRVSVTGDLSGMSGSPTPQRFDQGN